MGIKNLKWTDWPGSDKCPKCGGKLKALAERTKIIKEKCMKCGYVYNYITKEEE